MDKTNEILMEGECCQRCMLPYDYPWLVPNDLWGKVTGHEDGEGLLCIPCFNILAGEKQIVIWFEGAEGNYPNAIAGRNPLITTKRRLNES